MYNGQFYLHVLLFFICDSQYERDNSYWPLTISVIVSVGLKTHIDLLAVISCIIIHSWVCVLNCTYARV